MPGDRLTNYGFVLRNVGDAPATNIILRTSVACVTSNEVLHLDFYRDEIGATSALHGKRVLLNGEWASAERGFVPDLVRLAELQQRYGGDVLVRVSVEYERASPNIRRYSGHFDFLFSEDLWQLCTADETPRIRETLARYDSIPRDRRHAVLYRQVPDTTGLKMIQGWGTVAVHSSPGATNAWAVLTNHGSDWNAAIGKVSWEKHK